MFQTRPWAYDIPRALIEVRRTEYVGLNLIFCCSSALRTPLTAGATDRWTGRQTDRQTDTRMDGQTDRQNKDALGLLVTNEMILKLSSGLQ